MSKLTIVAHIILNPEKIDYVKTEMAKMFPITRSEKGCLQYDLHQDNKNPAYFMIYENWTSYETWQAHMNTENMDAYRKSIEGCVVEAKINEMTHLI
tara:strand:- start:207 stop:497 length:291 start_codon:yes stop_codon:yes gene_type:complete